MHGNSISAVKSNAKKKQKGVIIVYFFNEGKQRCFKISRLKEKGNKTEALISNI